MKIFHESRNIVGRRFYRSVTAINGLCEIGNYGPTNQPWEGASIRNHITYLGSFLLFKKLALN